MHVRIFKTSQLEGSYVGDLLYLNACFTSQACSRRVAGESLIKGTIYEDVGRIKGN